MIPSVECVREATWAADTISFFNRDDVQIWNAGTDSTEVGDGGLRNGMPSMMDQDDFMNMAWTF